MSTIAVLLAGGKGTRLRQSGRARPKPLLDIAGEPVINFMVRKLLKLNGDRRLEKIYILLRKTQHLRPTRFHPESVELDLERDFDLWRKNWFWTEQDRIDLVYEENLDPDPSLTDIFGDQVEGAIAGFARLLWDRHGLRTQGVTRVLVAAADNFLPREDFCELLDLCAPQASVNAYKDLGDPEKIREKFGCVTTHGEKGDEWLKAYSEKPANPGPEDTKVSVALYCFPTGHIELLREYVDLLRDSGEPEEAKARLGAPGFYLEWLAKRTAKQIVGQPQVAGVRAYEVHGPWSDIGDPTDLRIATYWHTHLGRLETVEDLMVAQETRQLDDNSFVLVRRLEIDPEERTVRIWHATDDALCCLRPDKRGLQTVRELASKATEAGDQWKAIQDALHGGAAIPKQELKYPILLSAGVFLFDCDGVAGGKLNANRALLPLLEKDLASKVDRRRLTTPAGRVDSLDVQQVCLDEMREEFVFYGTSPEGAPVIFCLRDAADREVAARETVLSAVRKGRIHVPGLSSADLDAEDAAASLIQIVGLFPLTPESCWKLETFLVREDIAGGQMERKVYARQGFVVIPDQDNHTLEFRIIRWGNITGQPHPVRLNKSTMQIGALRGIGDGDGYHRIPFVFSGKALVEYKRSIEDPKKDLRSVLRKSQLEAVKVLAIGDNRDGRFSQFDTSVPLLFTTTAVDQLLEHLDLLLA